MPLPDLNSRKALLLSILKKGPHFSLSEEDLLEFSSEIDTYSAADIMSLVKEAAMIPVREIPTE